MRKFADRQTKNTQVNVSITESTHFLSGSSLDTRGSWPTEVHSIPLWILSGYTRELANINALCIVGTALFGVHNVEFIEGSYYMNCSTEGV